MLWVSKCGKSQENISLLYGAKQAYMQTIGPWKTDAYNADCSTIEHILLDQWWGWSSSVFGGVT